MEQEQAKGGSVVGRLKDFVKDVRVEATKVSWPTRLELRDSTTVVIVTVLMVAVYAALDMYFQISIAGRDEVERMQIARALFNRVELDGVFAGRRRTTP